MTTYLDVSKKLSASSFLEHVLQLVVGQVCSGQLHLTFHLAFGGFAVLQLDLVVLRHHVHELAGHGHVLRLLHPQFRAAKNSYKKLDQWFPNFSCGRTTKNILVLREAQNIEL
jgi:hypothetical protein